MPNKTILFPFEIKIAHSDFCFYGIYYFNKDRPSESLFLFFYFISIITALGCMV